MATLNEVLQAARALDQTRVRLDDVQAQKAALQAQIATLNVEINALQVARDEQKTTLRTLAAALV